MIYQPNSKFIVLLALCMCLLFSFVPNSNASREGITVQPETVQFFLSMVGLETEIVDLDREDGLDRALYIDNLGIYPILIGFPEAGIGKGVPFLLTVEGEEIVVRVSEDGRLKDIAGNEVVMPAGIAEYVVCMSDLVTFMRLGLSMGEICPPDASESDCFSGALGFISYFFRGTIQCLLLLF
jgi:hypothetical protein